MMPFANPRALRGPYDDALRPVMNIERGRESRRWLSTWRHLHPGATPLWPLPGLARRTGVGAIGIKDESMRSPLGSFKALGASIALLRLIVRRFPERGFDAAGLWRGDHAGALRDFVVVSATDGNHGRSLAAAAESIGCRCVIVLHAHVSVEREQPIRDLGADIVRIEGNYNASVQEAARLARAHGWQVVSDTSYDGYEEIPRDVMQGYGIVADEVFEQVAAAGGRPFTHVVLQAGVGGLAAAIVGHFWERAAAERPTFIVVEPEQADCLLQSALRGEPSRATGSVDSVMAGLACGEPSPLAWRFLQPAVDFFMTIGDDQAEQAMRELAEGTGGDLPVVSGESGAAGLAALMSLAGDRASAAEVGLDAGSRVLLLNTEGATAPGVYERIVGRSAASVLEAQAVRLRDRGG